MAKKIEKPTIIKAAGNLPKIIEEFAGRVNNGEERISIAKMKSPKGWEEPGQTPEFDEYTIVLKGSINIETSGEKINVKAGEAFFAGKGEWVRYSTTEECEYIAVCIPAFSPETVHRDN